MRREYSSRISFIDSAVLPDSWWNVNSFSWLAKVHRLIWPCSKHTSWFCCYFSYRMTAPSNVPPWFLWIVRAHAGVRGICDLLQRTVRARLMPAVFIAIGVYLIFIRPPTEITADRTFNRALIPMRSSGNSNAFLTAWWRKKSWKVAKKV